MNKLVQFLNNNTEIMTATIIAKTVVKLNKKDVATKSEANPYDTVYKIQTFTVKLNQPYSQAVNEQRITEGKDDDFTAQKRKMGGVDINKSIIDKDGQLYLKCIEQSVDGKPSYQHNNKPIEKALFERFQPPFSASASRQDLDEVVKYKNFKIESIQSVIVNGQVVYSI